MDVPSYLETLKFNTPECIKEDPVNYASEIFDFLVEYEWLFDDVPVHFLSKQCESIPNSFKIEFLEMDEESSRILAQCPDSDCQLLPQQLQPFVDRINSLTMPSKFTTEHIKTTPLGHAFIIGMRAKKKHEVERLASLICDVNSDQNINTIVDVGAGKGWLGQVMTHTMNMDVINLEGNPNHNSNANLREDKVQYRLQSKQRRKQYSESMKAAHNKNNNNNNNNNSNNNSNNDSNCDILEKEEERNDGNNIENKIITIPPLIVHFGLDFNCDVNLFENLIWKKKDEVMKFKKDNNLIPLQSLNNDKEDFEQRKFCLISLHGCGDLSPSVLHTFVHCKSASTLVCVGCCYHRLSYCELKKKQNDITLSKMFGVDCSTTKSISNQSNSSTTYGLLL
jgi:hypothetical protein